MISGGIEVNLFAQNLIILGTKFGDDPWDISEIYFLEFSVLLKEELFNEVCIQ